MIKRTAMKILSAAACLVAFSCMQPEKDTNKAPSTKTFTLRQALGKIPATVARAKAVQTCEDDYSACLQQVTTNAQYQVCTDQYNACLDGGGVNSGLSNVCDEQSDSFNAESCFQSMGVCPTVVTQSGVFSQGDADCEITWSTCSDTATDYTLCDDQANACHDRVRSQAEAFFGACGVDLSSFAGLPFSDLVERIQSADACLCGGEGSVFGSNAGSVYSAFKISSAPGGPGFSAGATVSGGFKTSPAAGDGGFKASSSAGSKGFSPKTP